MSSAKSPALNPADLHDALQTALIEVSENAYFVFVEPADNAQFADAVGLVKDTWLKASVAFEGSFAGAVEIALPEPLGQWLVTSLLGMQGDETPRRAAAVRRRRRVRQHGLRRLAEQAQRRLPVRAAGARGDADDRGVDAARGDPRTAGAGLPDGHDQRAADAGPHPLGPAEGGSR